MSKKTFTLDEGDVAKLEVAKENIDNHEIAKTVWMHLGRKHGFKWETVEPGIFAPNVVEAEEL